jgi:hypothetical protein
MARPAAAEPGGSRERDRERTGDAAAVFPHGSAQSCWADALTQFSVLAPLFVVVASLLSLALPFPVLPPSHTDVPFFATRTFTASGISVVGPMVIALLTLLGLRRVALAAIAAAVAYWIFIQGSLGGGQLFAFSFYLLDAVALAVAPGTRAGRHLMDWGHGVVVVALAAAVQAMTLWYEAMGARFLQPSDIWAYAVIAAGLTLAVAVLAVARKMNPYLLVPALALLYPTLVAGFPSINYALTADSTLAYLAVVYGPPGLVACVVVLNAVMPRRPRSPLTINPAS